jgi:Xaa-Pro aminopeptidase
LIKEDEYKKRRDKLASKLSKNSVAVVFASKHKIRSNDTEYPYRQESNFYYLTGFREDESILVITKKRTKTKSFLFVKKKDKLAEIWDGKRLGVSGAKKRFLVDRIYPFENFEKEIKNICKNKQNIYMNFEQISQKFEIFKSFKNITQYKNISSIVEKMRLIKSNEEIKLIRKSVEIAKEAHHRAMRFNKVDKYEYQVQAEIEHSFKTNGAYSDAYTSVVAGGNNANTLHYIKNDEKLNKDDLLLIDAGCEYEYYASDITRTIPVSGKFSDAQKDVYDIVLQTQLRVLDAIKPGVKRSELQNISVKCLTEGLVKLGVLKGDLKKLIKKEAYKPYYPHGIGHWMGIDVHDQCPYKDKNNKEIVLKKGMVLTIEPGLYLDKDDRKVPSKYRGIGVRIEDDILVTNGGYENLSADIAKTVQEIESIKERS